MKFPILAMLASSPAHGYELKQELEQHFGAALPPLNTGQIYTSLARLERDGLVDADRVAQDSRPNKRVYRLTAAGAGGARRVGRPAHPGLAAARRVLHEAGARRTGGHRRSARAHRAPARRVPPGLRDLDRLGGRERRRAQALLIEGAALHLEADLKWLALCEERLDRGGHAMEHGPSHQGSRADLRDRRHRGRGSARGRPGGRRGRVRQRHGALGCGKSTLLHLLGGLDRPTAGEVARRAPRRQLSEARGRVLRRHEVGFVFQFFNLVANLTVADNIELPGLLAGCRRARRARAGASCSATSASPSWPARSPAASPAASSSAWPGPGARQPARHAARRRADRQPRQPERTRGPGPAAPPPRAAARPSSSSPTTRAWPAPRTA